MKNLKSFLRATTEKGINILFGRDEGDLVLFVNVTLRKGEKFLDYYPEDGGAAPIQFPVKEIREGGCDAWHYLHLKCPHHQ